ncbi:MAG TPA: glycosyltransferase family 1 protein [Acidimicrobiales bacterium]|nr:glycosyltransferase family 1 protein [Acidimicrobiales bacterium]
MTGTPIALSLDVSAVPIRPGGAGYYTIELARTLCGRAEVSLTLVSRRGDEGRWRELAQGRATVVGAVPVARPGRLVFEQTRFPRLLDALGVDVHHAPHYTMPERTAKPCVVTIHDCTFFDHPEWHVRSKALLFRRAIRRAARQAGALVCVSEVTASRLRACCDVRVPIVVAPHGVDHQRFTPEEPGPGADTATLAGIDVPADRPLVVFVGTLEPRKGVAPLVAAFDRVAGAHPDALLVLGGQMGWGLAETERALAAARHGDRIRRTGYLSDEAVPALLRRATVVAYPALEEGFGLPALEALACGAPLLTTEGTAMAEMAQGAARLVAPGDELMLAEALDEALNEGSAGPGATHRRRLGLEVAAQRTWTASAERHLEAYGRALTAPK